MIILASAIILTLSDTGIINKASGAVEETNLLTVKEVASLAWAEAYADEVRTVDGENGLEARVLAALNKSKVDITKYNINVTTNGVEVKLLSSMWVQEGFTVVKGDQVLKIGQLVDYDETAGGKKTGLTNVQ